MSYDQIRPGYFNKGRVTSISDESGWTFLNYDAAGRLVHKSCTVNEFISSNNLAEFTMDYFPSGQLESLTYPDGDRVGYSYDGLGRVKYMTGYFTNSVTATGEPGPPEVVSLAQNVTYTARDQLRVVPLGNNTITTHTYTPERGFYDSLKTIVRTPAGTLQDLDYQIDPTGQLRSVTSPFDFEGWTYDYDGVNRLKSATNHSDAQYSQTFLYDKADNLIDNSRVGTLTYPLPGAVRPHAVTEAGDDRSYGYDDNGNLVDWNGVTIDYNAENRPVRMTGGKTGDTEFVYDFDGKRVVQTVGDTTTLYLGDGYEVHGDRVVKYFRLGDSVISKRDGNVSYWLYSDRNRSIQVIADRLGREVRRFAYQPFGGTLDAAGG